MGEDRQIDLPPQPTPASTFACPSCDAVCEIILSEQEQWITCVSCGQAFAAPAMDVERPSQGTPDAPDAELDGLRIRQIATARRAAMQMRSYWVISAVACAVVAAQLVWSAVARLRVAGLGGWDLILLLVAAAMGCAAAYCLRRAAMLRAMAAVSPRMEEPLPDFDALGAAPPSAAQRLQAMHVDHRPD